jgi:hypothetical protein
MTVYVLNTCLMTACAGSASAVSAALALAIVLGCWNLHDSSVDMAAKKIDLHTSVSYPHFSHLCY